MATIEELNGQIAAKDAELAPLTALADAAQTRCLEIIASVVRVRIAEYARTKVLGDPDVTNALATQGHLADFKARVKSLEEGSGAAIDKCFRSAERWRHLHPSSYPNSDIYFKPYESRHGNVVRVGLFLGWSEELKCVCAPVNALFRGQGYKYGVFNLDEVEWPPEFWIAMADYSACARDFMTVWSQRQSLKEQCARLAAAQAWDEAG